MKKTTLISIIITTLSGCGTSDEETGSNNNPLTPHVVKGAIKSVSGNTIDVNGYLHDVSRVSYQDEELLVSDLQPGMMVEVSTDSQISNPDPSKHPSVVSLHPTMTGLISDIDPTAGTFKVNGIDLYYPQLSKDITNGDWVMVSSLPSANAGYQVLSVKTFDNPNFITHIEVEGLVTNLTSTTFTLGKSLQVDYSSAMIEDNEKLRNGQWVEVEGVMSGSLLTALEIDIEGYDNITSDSEIEGTITWTANDYSSFQLNYLGYFSVDSNTRFEDGNIFNLQTGARVEVNSILKNNSRVATKIEFEDRDDWPGNDWSGNDIEFEGRVIDIDKIDQSFVIQAGQKTATIYVNNRTQYEDRLTFDKLLNRFIEVEAYKINNQYIAAEIEAED